MKYKIVLVVLLLIMTTMMFQPIRSLAQDEPPYLRDRGTGIPMSQLGTYVHKGELLFYPFYEYYYDHDMEYKPEDFGYGLAEDFRGRYRAHEGLIFLGYGISDKLAVELEAAYISAVLDRSEDDRSTMPAEIKKSGIGDVEGELRFRWNHESAKKPEYFSYFETVFPTNDKYSLIGTSDWEFAFGTGLIKGFGWGTITPRVGVEYSAADHTAGIAYALEYLKRISDRFRFFVMLEGFEDEAALIPEFQWHFSRSAFLKANNGFGVTSKEIDLAPEIGMMFSF